MAYKGIYSISAFKGQTSIVSIVFGSQCSYIATDAFNGCTTLNEINDDNVITTIKSGAFAGTGLTTVIFNSLTSIEAGVFGSCSSLKSIYMSSLTSVPNAAFENCSSLKKIEIPSVSTIGTNAFYGCTGLKTINMSNCSTIGSYAFNSCTTLATINMPKLRNVSEGAFKGCTGLKTINIPNCSTIGSQAFYNCSNLSYINPSKSYDCNLSSCIRIETDAFNGCVNLTNINISRCSVIGDRAFCNCTKLNQIVSNSANYIGTAAFANTGLTTANFNQLTALGLGSYAFYSCITLSSVNIGNVTIIPQSAFMNCTSLSEINLSKIKKIYSNAFYNCTSLVDMSIPNCTLIEGNAFISCDSLITMSIPQCSIIMNSAFMNCKNLREINLNGCETIGVSAFYGCTGLAEISIPACKIIGAAAFYNCTSLNKVYINNTNYVCGLANSNAFYNFSNINNSIEFYVRAEMYSKYTIASIWSTSTYKDRINILPINNQIIYTIYSKNNDIKLTNDSNIKDSGVYEKNKIKYKYLTFNEKIEELTTDIFNITNETRKNLSSIILPSECRYIGGYTEENTTTTFENCINLKNITFPETIKHIDTYAFKNCGFEGTFNIPDTIRYLGEGAFAGCKNINEFSGNPRLIQHSNDIYNKKIIYYPSNEGNILICVLPNVDNSICSNFGIYTRLGNSCFHGCENMKCIDIPNTIKEIGANVFEGCKNLRVIHFNSSNPPTLDGKLFGEYEDMVPYPNDFIIFVPNGSGDAYKAAYVDYADYIHEISNGDEANDDEAFVTSDGNVIKVKITQEGEEKDIFGVKLS